MLNLITLEGKVEGIKEDTAVVNGAEVKTVKGRVCFPKYDGTTEKVPFKAQYHCAEEILKMSEGDPVKLTGRLLQKKITKGDQTRYVSFIDVTNVTANVNSIVLEGRFVADPTTETFEGRNGTVDSVKGRIAVKRNHKNEAGQYDTDFINIQAYGNTGTNVARFFHKGDVIIISGTLSNREYDGERGKGVFTEVQVRNFAFPASTRNNANAETAQAQPAPAQVTQTAAAATVTSPTSSSFDYDNYDDIEF